MSLASACALGLGSRSFISQWTDRATGRKRREPIDKWGSITIEQARAATRAKLGDVARGIDPAAERAAKMAADVADRADRAMTLGALLDDWSRKHLVNRRPQYALEASRAVRFAFADDLTKPASRLTRARILEVLDAMEASDRATMAGRTLAYARAAFGWALKREKVKLNPLRRVTLDRPGRRSRADSDGRRDGRRVAGGRRDALPFGPFFRLALLTLQRRDEVAGAPLVRVGGRSRALAHPGRANEERQSARRGAVRAGTRDPAHAARHQVEGKLCDLIFTTNLRAPISGLQQSESRTRQGGRACARRTADGALQASRFSKVGRKLARRCRLRLDRSR